MAAAAGRARSVPHRWCPLLGRRTPRQRLADDGQRDEEIHLTGAGLVNTVDGEPFLIMSFTVVRDRITAIDILSDRERLEALDSSAVLG
ncbi:hypothetical protein [Nocardia cyriacigeorgica]|uniref:hypothetical protein n=1 Tax=Nocardia cyriacigeorgica TaxID=135487 RepID=UPI001BB1DE20|nr:hypothetical protein [Nocardia cyriacigeorgica]